MRIVLVTIWVNAEIVFIVSTIPNENDSVIPAQGDGARTDTIVIIQLLGVSGVMNV